MQPGFRDAGSLEGPPSLWPLLSPVVGAGPAILPGPRACTPTLRGSGQDTQGGGQTTPWSLAKGRGSAWGRTGCAIPLWLSPAQPHKEKGVEGGRCGLPKGIGRGLQGGKQGLGSQSRPQAPRLHLLRLRLTPQTIPQVTNQDSDMMCFEGVSQGRQLSCPVDEVQWVRTQVRTGPPLPAARPLLPMRMHHQSADVQALCPPGPETPKGPLEAHSLESEAGLNGSSSLFTREASEALVGGA